jgi:hypothetical protein
MRRKTHARVPVARLVLLAGVLLSLASMVGLGSMSEGWRDEIARRLAALRPERPAEYLALAEDLVDRASNGVAADADRAMARTLASLAGAIDVQGMGRSAALFLVENSSNDAQRSRMLAVAALLDRCSPSCGRSRSTAAAMASAPRKRSDATMPRRSSIGIPTY